MKKITILLLLATVLFSACEKKQEVKKSKNHQIIGKPELTLTDNRMTPEALWAFGRVSGHEISPDGKNLYIVGRNSELGERKGDTWPIIENSLGLEIVRAENGSRIARYDTEASDISYLL